MTRDELAALLNGRPYRQETSRSEQKMALEAGLVVIYGASDDLLEFDGAIHEEIDAYDGTKCYIQPDKTVTKFKTIGSVKVEAIFDPSEIGATWLIRTDAAHSTFDTFEDGELFCRGIVLNLAEVFAGHDSEEQLRAAAPEMFDALKEAAAYIEDRSAGSARFWDLYDAALAKAVRP